MAVEIGMVRQSSYNDYSEGQERPARLNRRGELVVADFWTQMVLDGRMFHMQIGTEDAPVASTTSIDDQLSWMVADNSVGYVHIPARYQVSMGAWTTGTIVLAMLEVDNAKIRYSSGGTAYVPANLRTDNPRVATGTFVVGTDVTVAAKTAVPGSIELWRHMFTEDNVGTSTGAENADAIFCARTNDIPAAIVGTGSVVHHFGCATADVTGYGAYEFVQLPTSSVT